MEIQKYFNELICKYNIDKHFPGFEKCVKASAIAEKSYAILCQKYENVVLVGNEQTAVEWFQRNICHNEALVLVISDLDKFSLITEMKEQSVCYLIVSYEARDELKVKLCEQGVTVKSIYEIFEDHQIYFEHSFYDVYGLVYHNFRTKEISRDFKDFDMNEIFFWHRRNYEMAESREERKRYLEKLIFDCAYVKDFILLKEYIKKHTKEIGESDNYICFLQEVDVLLGKITQYMLNRNQKDCLMIWLDALEYGDEENMPFLRGMDDQAYVFDKIYTVTPYTGATFKTLFGGIRVIEEKSFKVTRLGDKNSEFLQGLGERGYLFRYYGELDLVEQQYKPAYFYSIYTVMTQIFWDILCDIVAQKDNEKGFFVLHEVLQTHIPYISMGLTGDTYTNREAWAGQQEESEKILQNSQALESRKYVDKQLEFWNTLLPKCMYKIYMSDHGHNFFGRFHPIMKIMQQDMPVKHDRKLKSYYNFGKIMLYILDHNHLDTTQFDSESVIIQDVDYYYKDYILDVIQRKTFSPDCMIGYQGIVTEKDMLLHYRNGLEYYQKNINDGICVTEARLAYLRSLLSRSQIDIYGEEKFKYSRIIWEAECRCKERTMDIENLKEKIIRQLVDRIPEKSIVAVRGGGFHTLRFLMLLNDTQRQKIHFIIDRDKQCVAGKIGKPVLTTDEMQNEKIDCLIISSYDYRRQWKEELLLANYSNVIDIYEELEKEGIYCNKEFYKKNFINRDFDHDERRDN